MNRRILGEIFGEFLLFLPYEQNDEQASVVR